MISEGLAAGKPVYALLPDVFPGEGLHTSFVTRHVSRQRLRRVAIAGMAGIDLAGDAAGYFKVLTDDVMAEMAERVIALIDRRTSSAEKAAESIAV
jgi:hypothetical protein